MDDLDCLRNYGVADLADDINDLMKSQEVRVYYSSGVSSGEPSYNTYFGDVDSDRLVTTWSDIDYELEDEYGFDEGFGDD